MSQEALVRGAHQARDMTSDGNVYIMITNLMEKVLDFVQDGGPFFTVDRTVFELWLGSS